VLHVERKPWGELTRRRSVAGSTVGEGFCHGDEQEPAMVLLLVILTLAVCLGVKAIRDRGKAAEALNRIGTRRAPTPRACLDS
jgi:hypothetical protein